jgi:hypothetical protein
MVTEKTDVKKEVMTIGKIIGKTNEKKKPSLVVWAQ